MIARVTASRSGWPSAWRTATRTQNKAPAGNPHQYPVGLRFPAPAVIYRLASSWGVSGGVARGLAFASVNSTHWTPGHSAFLLGISSSTSNAHPLTSEMATHTRRGEQAVASDGHKAILSPQSRQCLVPSGRVTTSSLLLHFGQLFIGLFSYAHGWTLIVVQK